MDSSTLTRLVRSWTQSRRTLLAGALTAKVGRHDEASAKGRKKRKKAKKPKPNAFGCLEVDVPCKTAEQCCSGICEGKKGKRTCRAHGAGSCKPQGGLCTEPDPGLVPCNNVINCWCMRTTANSIFCGDLEGKSECAHCQKDADCLALGFPAGSACLRVAEGACTGACASGMMCMAPCNRGQEPSTA